jgi:predicted transposase YbfD/YdcC
MVSKENALERLHEIFDGLQDPRDNRAKRHELLNVIIIAVCGTICGADTWVDMEEFGKAKEEWFRSFLDLPNGIPSHDTFGRVFELLDPEQFQRCFLAWAAAMRDASGGKLVALDGKTLRRSHDQANGKNALHLVSAWSSKNHLVLGQLRVEGHSNEITAIPALLELLTLEGCTVTIDAMGTQKEIAEKIQESGAEYVLGLKRNQESLYEAVEDSFAQARGTNFEGVTHESVETVNGGHGRVETRRYWTISDREYLEYLDPDKEWKGLRCIGMVEADRQQGEKASTQRRYYISSLSGNAQEFSKAVRGHWDIENGLHWILDVAFREDDSRVRTGNAAENLAVLRRLAVNLLRADKTAKVGVKAKRLKAGWDEDYMLNVMTTLPQPT